MTYVMMYTPVTTNPRHLGRWHPQVWSLDVYRVTCTPNMMVWKRSCLFQLWRFAPWDEGLHPEMKVCTLRLGKNGWWWHMAYGNRCLVQGCHDGVGRLVIDMVNPARLAVSALVWLKWMASSIDIYTVVTSIFFGMRSFPSKLVMMMKKKKTSITHCDGDDLNDD